MRTNLTYIRLNKSFIACISIFVIHLKIKNRGKHIHMSCQDFSRLNRLGYKLLFFYFYQLIEAIHG